MLKTASTENEQSKDPPRPLEDMSVLQRHLLSG